jgi:hypothetical protein
MADQNPPQQQAQGVPAEGVEQQHQQQVEGGEDGMSRRKSE